MGCVGVGAANARGHGMNVPDPVVSVRALAASHPWAAHDLDYLFDVLRRGHSCASGPLMPQAAVLGAKGIQVERPCQRCWGEKVAWHTYCREHGYPRPERDGRWVLPDGHPPAPVWHRDCEDCSSLVLSWREVRGLLDDGPVQLDLLSGVAA